MSPDLHLASNAASTVTDGFPSASAGSPIRVVLADGHAQMRRSLRILLEDEEDIEVSGEASDLGSVASAIEDEQPQVLVLDLEMPGGSSLEAIGQLRERAPNTQIVASTMEHNPGYAQRALAAGALGFVLKELADEELAPAIRAAARGEEYISPRIAPGLDAIQRSLTQDKLSAREVKIVRLTALGHTSAAVARKLRISPRSVENQRARILTKLGISTRAELVQYALRHHLLT